MWLITYMKFGGNKPVVTTRKSDDISSCNAAMAKLGYSFIAAKGAA